MIARLEQRVEEDGLTGLLNRRGFDRVFAQAVSFAERYAEDSVLVLLDINDFKTVNDTYGHLAGDKALVAIARLMQHQFRRTDSIARIGGDEFAILMRNVGLEAAARLAGRLVQAIVDLRLEHEGGVVPLAASFGLARCEGQDPLAIFQQADTAMYHMKNARRR
jgi:diguanylate cyclase (GGDEF)-like protein